MTPETIAIAALAVAVFGHAMAYLFKSPKEVNGELSNQIHAIRHDQRVQAEMAVRHDEVIKHLIQALERLTLRIDRLEPYQKTSNPQGRRGTSGRD